MSKQHTISHTEENYLKAIFKLSEKTNGESVSTNSIAEQMSTTAASVSDMVKRLSGKDLLVYEKYKGVNLSKSGRKIATNLIRKHRLWEVFLLDKLEFNWHEVHDVAEELEHIHSALLIERLDAFLEHPKFDPHGDPIPDANGNFTNRPRVLLSTLTENVYGVVIGVEDHSTPFLKHLAQLGIALGTTLKIIKKYTFDQSMRVVIDDSEERVITAKVANSLYLKKVKTSTLNE